MLGGAAWAAGGAPAPSTPQAPQVFALSSDERLLPANSVADEAIRAPLAAGRSGHAEFAGEAQFRAQTAWEKNHRLVLSAVALIVLQATLITALTVALYRRRRTEEALRESEEQASLAAASAGVGLWAFDLATRKHAEEEARRHHAELAYITRTNMLGELSGSLAHELGQPLGAVLANAEAAELHLSKAAPNLEEVRAILADIRGDSIRAGAIVHGMRALLRRSDMEFEPVDLPGLIEELKKLAGPDAAVHHTTLDFQLPACLTPIRGQRVQLQQVLLNLILNGIHAMKDCPTSGRHLAITVAAREESVVEFAVTDSGTGVPAEKLEEVFAPFFSTKPSGLGMGLAICRRIVSAHGGRIWIENNAGPGATVRFTLPGAAGNPTR